MRPATATSAAPITSAAAAAAPARPSGAPKQRPSPPASAPASAQAQAALAGLLQRQAAGRPAVAPDAGSGGWPGPAQHKPAAAAAAAAPPVPAASHHLPVRVAKGPSGPGFGAGREQRVPMGSGMSAMAALEAAMRAACSLPSSSAPQQQQQKQQQAPATGRRPAGSNTQQSPSSAAAPVPQSSPAAAPAQPHDLPSSTAPSTAARSQQQQEGQQVSLQGGSCVLRPFSPPMPPPAPSAKVLLVCWCPDIYRACASLALCLSSMRACVLLRGILWAVLVLLYAARGPRDTV